MFRRRITLQKRDRESGLGFNWRVPVSNTMSFLVAFFLVGSAAVILAVGVKVRIGKARAGGERRAVMTLIPTNAMGAALERMAKDAGPYPFREDGERRESRWRQESPSTWAPSDPDYVPTLAAMSLAKGNERDLMAASIQMLPPLPDPLPLPEIPVERTTALSFRLMGGSESDSIQVPSRRVPVAEAAGWLGERYLIETGVQGQVLTVQALDPSETASRAVAWLLKGRVETESATRHWWVVECMHGDR
ncbi:hypothetical protein HNR46_000255 [Haloferula luteola]|uniref:Uncharacterized protein n=1 Tax=Haloferula luteola TaxID=595692 RepID=A0A840V2Z6_9BACT|nr:hypothetical protein [Haloferula luteola]MBB5350034.1 hypothetical protein [Haloferula luteola]